MIEPATTPGSEQPIFALSLSQTQVWLDQQSFPKGNNFNVSGIGYVNGPVDLDILHRSMTWMVSNNDALRLLPLTDGRQQLVSQWSTPLLDILDFTQQPDPHQAMLDFWREISTTPFLLDGKQRPWSMMFVKIKANCWVFVATYHHLILDGYSMALNYRQLGNIYNQLLTSKTPADMDRPKFRQFIQETEKYLQSAAYQQDKRYWNGQFPTLPSLILPQRYQHKNNQPLPTAQHHSYEVLQPEYQQFQAFAKSQQVTTFHLYLAAIALYFCRFHQQSEIVIGLPILNRSGKRYKETIGMFVMMIPLRITIEPTMSVSLLLTTIMRTLLQAYRHARYPMSHFSRDLAMVNQGQDRLFDIIVSFEIRDFKVYFGDTPIVNHQQHFPTTARYPLSISVAENDKDEPLKITLSSSCDHFSLAETEQLGQHIHQLIQRMLNNAEQNVYQLPLLSAVEITDLVIGKHADIGQHPQPQPFIVTFEHQAVLRPNAIAIRWASGEINYRALNQQANRLAHRLQTMGVQPQNAVAVVSPRKLETLVAYLAVAKAGCAFVPMEPNDPEARILQLIDQSHSVVVLVSAEQQGLAATIPLLVIDNDSAPQYDETLPCTDLTIKPQADDLAYILFTSGSTGQPKGVMMSHAPLTRRMAWLARTFNFTPKDVWLQSIQLTFDPALIEIVLPLSHGATVALAPPGQVAPTDIAYHAELLGATTIIFVPTTLRYFNQTAHLHPNLKLRIAISGGEVLTKRLAKQFVQLTGAQLYNLYGPTEACIFATAQLFDAKESANPHADVKSLVIDDTVPIGEPVDDTRIYILDSHLQPVPNGAIGEICIGGTGLAEGYLNGVAADRFIADPFVSGLRIYRSGDSGYWDNDGKLQFVGRIDNQIKIRGQRMEPSDIELILTDINGVSAAAVKKYENQLHVWLVIKPDSNQDSIIKAVRHTLPQKLPTWMVPSHYHVIDALPQQVSGKLDYKALVPNPTTLQEDPPPAGSAPIANQHSSEPYSAAASQIHTPPRTELEKLLLNLWKQVLPNAVDDIHSDFFSAGGDSIIGLNLLSKINQQIDQQLPLSMLIHNPTVGSLATAITHRHQPLLINLSGHENGTTIYLAASGHGDALRFAPLAAALEQAPQSYHLVMLQPPLPQGYSSYKTIGQLAEYYATLIEQRHHHSAPVIAGFSIGGLSGLETMRRLISKDIDVAGLVLIDTTYPIWLVKRSLLWRFGGWLVKTFRLQELSINQRNLATLFSDSGLNGQIAALSQYQPQPLSIPTRLIISSGFSRWHRLLFKPWRTVFSEHLTEQQLTGFHGTLFNAEHVKALAEALMLEKK